MLLIHDDQREVFKYHILFEESVCTDDDIGNACLDSLEEGGTRDGFVIQDMVTTSEKCEGMLCVRKNTGKIVKMLASEYFGGSEDDGLRFLFGDDPSSKSGDDSFATADITIEETVHRTRFAKVGENF